MNNIQELTACPYCGSTFGYYQKMYVSGWVEDTTLFEKDNAGNGVPYNSEMYEGLNYSREGQYYYCCNCRKRVAKISVEKKNNE